MPGYVWIFPVSIMVGLACVFVQAAQAGKLGGLNLAPLAWPALFISLGWNFLEFGFYPPGGGAPAWGWLVCGVVFWLMGFIPLVFFIVYFWLAALLFGIYCGVLFLSSRTKTQETQPNTNFLTEKH